MLKIITKIIGTKNDRELRQLTPMVEAVNRLEPEMQALTADGIRAKTAERKVRVQPTPLQLDPCTLLDISGSQPQDDIFSPTDFFENLPNPGQDAIVRGLGDFMLEKAHISLKDRSRHGLNPIDVPQPTFQTRLANNRRICLSVWGNTLEGFPQIEDFLNRAVQRADARPTRVDQRQIDVEEEHFHVSYFGFRARLSQPQEPNFDRLHVLEAWARRVHSLF